MCNAFEVYAALTVTIVIILLLVFVRRCSSPKGRRRRVTWANPLKRGPFGYGGYDRGGFEYGCEYIDVAPTFDPNYGPLKRVANESLNDHETFYVRGSTPSERELSANIASLRWKSESYVSGRADFNQYESGYNNSGGDDLIFARRSIELNPVEIMTPARPKHNSLPAATSKMQLTRTVAGRSVPNDRITDYHHDGAGNAYVTI